MGNIRDRIELLNFLPKDGIVAEIGVDTGEYSQKIFDINKPKELYLIDSWASERYNEGKMYFVKERFGKNNSIKILHGDSCKIISEFQDNFFDWVYIDSNHTYNHVLSELIACCDKIKKNGFIAGHDYAKIKNYGVIEAVDFFCRNYHWKIREITCDENTNPSFVIERNG